MECSVCGFEFEIEDLINWSDVVVDYEVYGQDGMCPECGTPIWIASWEIEGLMKERIKEKEEKRR